MDHFSTVLNSRNEQLADNELNTIDPTTLGPKHIRIALEKGMYEIAKRLLDEFHVVPHLGNLHIGLIYGATDEILRKILEKGVVPNEVTLNLALNYHRYEIAKRVMSLGVLPNVINLNSVLIDDDYEIAKHIINIEGFMPDNENLKLSLEKDQFEIAKHIINKKGFMPDNENLKLSLEKDQFEIAKHIINKEGFMPDNENLKLSLEKDQFEIAKHIINKEGFMPDNESLKLSLEKGQFEIAESILDKGVQPDEGIKIVKDYMDHKRGMQSLRDFTKKLSLKLEAFSINQTPPGQSDTIRKAFKVILDFHSPLKRKREESNNSQNKLKRTGLSR